MGMGKEGDEWGLWVKGPKRKGDAAAAAAEEEEEEGWRSWSMRERRKGEEAAAGTAKGAAGMPVNS